MKRLTFTLLAAFCALTAFGQSPPRFELLTKPPAPLARLGGSAASGAPEISRDGAYILFVSLADNLTTNFDTGAANLYMANRQTHAVTLISVATNGAPANESIEGFQFSANGRKILFETRASNLVPNDTNNESDVFLRDLDLNQTILISVNATGGAAGGSSAAMSGDGSRVVFVCGRNLVAADRNPLNDVYLRDVLSNQTQIVSVNTQGQSAPNGGCSNPSISQDGRIVSFVGPYDLIAVSGNFANAAYVRDLELRTTVRPYRRVQGLYSGSLLSADGQWLMIAGGVTNNGVSNFVARYHIPTGAMETIETNNLAVPYSFLDLSDDGSVLIFGTAPPNAPSLWRQSRGLEELFPSTGSLSLSVPVCELSRDGKFAAFMAVDAQAGAQAVLQNLDTREQAFVSPFNQKVGMDDVNAYPTPSADGSFVAFVAETDPLDGSQRPIANIYVWNRSTGESELVSVASRDTFQSSAPAGASHFEKGVSADGKRILFRSLEPVDAQSGTKPVWNLFLLDRATGQKQLISRNVEGSGGANASSFGAVLSGDSRRVAFYSWATNLTLPYISNAPALYLRDLEGGVTQRIYFPTNTLSQVSPPLVSLSHDGRFVAFASLIDLGSGFRWQAFLFDSHDQAITLVATNLGGGLFPLRGFNLLLSPDGENLALQVYEPGGASTTYLRPRQSGAFRLLKSVAANPLFPPAIAFNSQSTTLFYPTNTSFDMAALDLLSSSSTLACENCSELDPSADARWIAFTRRAGPGNRKQVFLRDRQTSTEILVSTNGNHDSFAPRLTQDARFLIFESRASNLVTNDNNASIDIFVFDRIQNRLEMLIRNPAGMAPNNASQRPVLSGDSSTVVFKTFATDLIPGDYNEAPDLFAYTLFTPLKITAIETAAAKVRLTWQSTPDAAYRIQARASVESGAWEDQTPSLPGAAGSTTFELPLPAGGTQFYRVVRE